MVGQMTVAMAVAELFPAVESDEVEAIVARLVIIVPGRTPVPTLTTNVPTLPLPLARLAMVTLTEPFVAPALGREVTVQPAGALNETKLVPLGNALLDEMPDAVVGPLFVTPIEIVRLSPATTLVGLTAVDTDTSELMNVVRVLLGVSLPAAFVVVVVAEAFSTMLVAAATPWFTRTTNWNVALAFAAKLAVVNVTLVVGDPVSVLVMAVPPICVSETKVVFAGMGNVTVVEAAASGPLFVSAKL
jgi:hypothetical protein